MRYLYNEFPVVVKEIGTPAITKVKDKLISKYAIQTWVFLSLIALLFLYHLYTLEIAPIPWFDDTFFASITASYNATGKFNLDIAPFAYDGEILLYGPLYFWITSYFTKILGFDIFSFRLAGVIFGFLCLMVFYKMLRLHLRKGIAYFVIIAFALDSLFNSNMHSGRMEPVALFFALCSILLYLHGTSKSYNSSLPKLLIFASSGIAFSFALLTTPRIGVLLIALGICQLCYVFKNYKKEKTLQIITFGIALVAVYLMWVFYAFRSIANLLEYYSGFTEEYMGSKFSLYRQQLPLLAITFASFIIGISVNHKKYLSELVILSALSIVVFFIVVNDTGQYSVLIMPFQYFLIGATVSLVYYNSQVKGSLSKRIVNAAPLIAILCINIAAFTIKFITIYVTSETRNPKHITAFIKSHIPSESKVIGDDSYYYAVSFTNSDFQYIHLFKDGHEREYYQRKIYDYDYIVWSDKLQQNQPNLLEIYKNNSKLVKIAKFVDSRTKSLPLAERILSALNIPVHDLYSCTLYKRIK